MSKRDLQEDDYQKHPEDAQMSKRHDKNQIIVHGLQRTLFYEQDRKFVETESKALELQKLIKQVTFDGVWGQLQAKTVSRGNHLQNI